MVKKESARKSLQGAVAISAISAFIAALPVEESAAQQVSPQGTSIRVAQDDGREMVLNAAQMRQLYANPQHAAELDALSNDGLVYRTVTSGEDRIHIKIKQPDVKINVPDYGPEYDYDEYASGQREVTNYTKTTRGSIWRGFVESLGIGIGMGIGQGLTNMAYNAIGGLFGGYGYNYYDNGFLGLGQNCWYDMYTGQFNYFGQCGMGFDNFHSMFYGQGGCMLPRTMQRCGMRYDSRQFYDHGRGGYYKGGKFTKGSFNDYSRQRSVDNRSMNQTLTINFGDQTQTFDASGAFSGNDMSTRSESSPVVSSRSGVSGSGNSLSTSSSNATSRSSASSRSNSSSVSRNANTSNNVVTPSSSVRPSRPNTGGGSSTTPTPSVRVGRNTSGGTLPSSSTNTSLPNIRNNSAIGNMGGNASKINSGMGAARNFSRGK